MDNNSISFNPASGADSTSVQSIWISTSTITAAAILPCSAAPIASTMKAARWLVILSVDYL